ncbi:ribosome biogenesis protein NSA2 [Pyrenophora tritici-repentis]|nr:ribosome biogenesis protein NSA2 [Pyrenophora tritici-repentis]
MPQNEYIERHTKLHGKRFDHDERQRKRIAREGHNASKKAQNFRGLRAKLHAEKRRKEKIQMKQKIRAHEERNVKSNEAPEPATEALPSYLLDRSNEKNAKALSSAIKQKRNEKAARFSVPLPKVKGISEEEMFSVVKTGKKTKKKSWKRMITKPTFVGPGFTRRPVKYEVRMYSVCAAKKCTNFVYSALLGLWVCVTRRQTSRTPNSTLLSSCQSYQ